MADDTKMTFAFTDAQWTAYQNLPEQGYSHRAHLQWLFNAWLVEHDRQVAEKAWDEGLDYGADDIGRAASMAEHGESDNPYRKESTWPFN